MEAEHIFKFFSLSSNTEKVTSIGLVNSTLVLRASFDPLNLTHVLVFPTAGDIRAWQNTRGTSTPHPYTIALRAISVRVR